MKKRYIIIPTILILIIVSALVSLNMYLNSIYTEQVLKKTVTEYITDKFNKAVIFETISVNMTGNIKIKNLKISNTDDFNDADVLLSNDTAIVHLDMKKLLRKEVSVKKIVFYNSTVNFVKSFDSTYKDKIRADFKFRSNFKNFQQLIGTDIHFKNLNFIYKEYFKNGNWGITVINSDLFIRNSKGVITADMKGEIPSIKSDKQKPCIIKIHAENRENSTFSGELTGSVEFANLDLSYLNDIFANLFNTAYEISGILDNKLDFAFSNYILQFKGGSDLRNLTLSRKDPKYMLISDFSGDVDFDGSLNLDKKQFNLKKIMLKNDFLQVDSSVSLVDDLFSVKLDTKEINLKKLSEFYKPEKIADYTGTVSLSGDIQYNKSSNVFLKHNLNLSLKKFGINMISGDLLVNILKKTDLSLALNKDRFSCSMKGSSGKSDFEINAESDFVREKKTHTINKIKIKSDNFELSKIISGKDLITRFFRELALKDSKGKYQEIFFTERKEGILVNSNDLQLELSIKDLFLFNTAYVKNVGLRVLLENGHLNTESFTAEGYGATYMFDVNSNFNFYWPKFEYKFSANGIHLEEFSKDAHLKGVFSGSFSVEESYSTDFYKMSQLIENAKYDFRIYGSQIILADTNVQRDALEFLNDSRIQSDLKNLEIKSFDYSLKTVRQESSLNGFSVLSDKFNFQLRSKLDEDTGIVPMKITFPLDKVNLTVNFNPSSSGKGPFLYNEEQETSFYLKNILK